MNITNRYNRIDAEPETFRPQRLNCFSFFLISAPTDFKAGSVTVLWSNATFDWAKPHISRNHGSRDG